LFDLSNDSAWNFADYYVHFHSYLVLQHIEI